MCEDVKMHDYLTHLKNSRLSEARVQGIKGRNGKYWIEMIMARFRQKASKSY